MAIARCGVPVFSTTVELSAEDSRREDTRRKIMETIKTPGTAKLATGPQNTARQWW